MKYFYALWVIAMLISVVAVWYRDRRYPNVAHCFKWKKSWSHRVALVSFFISLSGGLVFFWLYVKDLI